MACRGDRLAESGTPSSERPDVAEHPAARERDELVEVAVGQRGDQLRPRARRGASTPSASATPSWALQASVQISTASATVDVLEQARRPRRSTAPACSGCLRGTRSGPGAGVPPPSARRLAPARPARRGARARPPSGRARRAASAAANSRRGRASSSAVRLGRPLQRRRGGRVARALLGLAGGRLERDRRLLVEADRRSGEVPREALRVVAARAARRRPRGERRGAPRAGPRGRRPSGRAGGGRRRGRRRASRGPASSAGSSASRSTPSDSSAAAIVSTSSESETAATTSARRESSGERLRPPREGALERRAGRHRIGQRLAACELLARSGAFATSSRASGFPCVASQSCPTTSGATDAARRRLRAAARRPPGRARAARAARAQARRTSAPRPRGPRAGSRRSRRPAASTAKSSASHVARSSQCASSTRTSSGFDSAAAASRLSVAAQIVKRSCGRGSPSPSALLQRLGLLRVGSRRGGRAAASRARAGPRTGARPRTRRRPPGRPSFPRRARLRSRAGRSSPVPPHREARACRYAPVERDRAVRRCARSRVPDRRARLNRSPNAGRNKDWGFPEGATPRRSAAPTASRAVRPA